MGQFGTGSQSLVLSSAPCAEGRKIYLNDAKVYSAGAEENERRVRERERRNAQR